MKNGKNIVCIAILAAGCAAHSGVVPMGQGEYLISKQAATGFSGLGKLKAAVLREASGHCSGQRKDFEVISTEESKPPFVLGNYPRVEIRFRCI